MNLQENIQRIREMMGLLTEETKTNYNFKVNFKGGIYTNSEDNFAELDKNINEILEQLKTSPTKKLLKVRVQAGESSIPNTDNEKGGKVEPGFLSLERLKTIKKHINDKLNNLKKTYTKLHDLNFIPSGEPKLNVDYFINKSKTPFIGQPFCPVDKIKDKTDKQGYECKNKNFNTGEGVPNWENGKLTVYKDIRQKYIEDQFVTVSLSLSDVTSVDEKKVMALNTISIGTYREAIAAINQNLNLFFYQYSIPASIASGKDYRKLPGQLLTMNKYFGFYTDQSKDGVLNLKPLRVNIVPNGSEDVELIIPNNSGVISNDRWVAKIAPSYTLNFEPSYAPNTPEYKSAWLFAAFYIIKSTSKTTNDWKFISNKPKDIDYSVIEKIQVPPVTVPAQQDPTAQYNMLSTMNGGTDFSFYKTILQNNGLLKTTPKTTKK